MSFGALPAGMLYPMPSPAALQAEFAGKKIEELNGPAAIVDVAIARRNCNAMLKTVDKLKCRLRAHVKTHKVFLRWISAVFRNTVVSIEDYVLHDMLEPALTWSTDYPADGAPTSSRQAASIGGVYGGWNREPHAAHAQLLGQWAWSGCSVRCAVLHVGDSSHRRTEQGPCREHSKRTNSAKRKVGSRWRLMCAYQCHGGPLATHWAAGTRRAEDLARRPTHRNILKSRHRLSPGWCTGRPDAQFINPWNCERSRESALAERILLPSWPLIRFLWSCGEHKWANGRDP